MLVQLKIAGKLDSELLKPFTSLNLSVGSFKFFVQGKEVAKDTIVSQLNLVDNAQLLSIEGLGKPFKFTRFNQE